MSVCLDRFAHGLPDTVAQELQPWAVCEGCGQNIYPGDDYLDVDGAICCDDFDCLKLVTGASLKEAGAA